ncbi:hypothetical protein POM88_016258 [Heracleum sosnowskyi]|uniref:DUF4408 domain-containing protein n=1 Tax=Heracleum sosnowskyi TaxID=360622 RepID=A0AAD8MSS8_9APIA|nr:hypothetical protein POM88_016258 [Heracleum sosnowskyi]
MLMAILLMARDLFGNRGKSRLETTVWAIQLLLLLVGIVSVVVVFKTAVIPYSFSKVSTLPQLCLSLKLWLSPPYIYIIINFIIVFIVVSSTFHRPRVNEEQHNDYGGQYADPPLQQPNDDGDYGANLQHPVPTPSSQSLDINNDHDFHFPNQIPETSPSLPNLDTPEIVYSEKITNEQSLEKTTNAEAHDFPEHIKHILVTEHSVSKGHDEEFETMEATWEAITEATKSAPKKELKKIETWTRRKNMRKLETFNESLLERQRGGLMRDLSIGHAELNSRVEAFISKFNMDMRLQRQESDERFLDMINR